MVQTVTLSCDAWDDGPGGYIFFSGQIVTLTAKVVSTNGEPMPDFVYFSPVGLEGDDVTRLEPYGKRETDWYPVENQVLVTAARVSSSTGEATLKIWVGGRALEEPDRLLASLTPQMQAPVSQPLDFAVVGVVISVPRPANLAFMPAVKAPVVPKDAGGNYGYYRFEVYDRKWNRPIPRMRVTITANMGTSNVLKNGVALYDRFEPGGPPLEPSQTAYGEPYYIDLLTDDHGVAELYLCQRANTFAGSELRFKIGVYEGVLGLFLVTDMAASEGDVKGPWLEEDTPVDLGRLDSLTAVLPEYEGVSAGDQVFLFCNGLYQGGHTVVDVPPGGNLGTMLFGTRMLVSKDYGDPMPNRMCYVVHHADRVQVSSKFEFMAHGVVSAVTMPDDSTALLSAPSILDGGRPVPEKPINLKAIAQGLTIGVPLQDSRIGVGDEISLSICINGFRRGSDNPVGVAFDGPDELIVTPRMIGEAWATWWFPQYLFNRFGQDRHGQTGTLEVAYSVFRPNKALVGNSKIYSIAIDTIGPDGRNI